MSKSIKLKDKNYWSAESIVVDKIGTTLKDFLFFKKGESYTYGNNLTINGYVSARTTRLYVTLTTPKSMKNVTSVTASGNIYNVRGVSGYIDINNTNTALSNFTVTATIADDYHIYLVITKSEKWTATNNTTISMQFNGLKLTFS